VLRSDISHAKPIRIVVADRHTAARSGVRVALEGSGFAIVADCGDAASAVAAVARERADLCLIDAELAGADDAVRALVALPFAPKIVVLGTFGDEQAFFTALDLGAAGYLLKDVASVRLADDLKSVAAGGIALAPALAASLVDHYRRRRSRPSAPAGLSDREWEALTLLAEGLSTKEIALRLRLSPTTVRRHISSAVKRIGASGRQNAVAWIRRVQRSERE
jgi:DNA-binding NarL/FixJ family response regulator